MKFVKKISKWSYKLVLLSVAFGIWSSILWTMIMAPPLRYNQSITEMDTVQFYIPSGTAAQQIGNSLEAAGLIRSAKVWKLWTFLLVMTDRKGEFQAGTYQFSRHDHLPTIAGKIWQGKVMRNRFTIPEGWSIKQMGNYFESKGYFTAEEFIAASSIIPQEKYPWLPNNLPHLEGFLYPDTYQLSSDRLNSRNIIRLMLDRFEEVALPLYQEAENHTSFTLQEWVTMASIVEKEAVVARERPIIAGVFIGRLRRGMKLQTDPTVEYGLGIRQTADRPLTYTQVKMPSPYNTYINPGLPPTPIASPGTASLIATLYPEATEYVYFVARYDGTHVFSKTLAEHEAAIRAIRQERQGQ